MEWSKRAAAIFLILAVIASLAGCNTAGANSYRRQRKAIASRSRNAVISESNLERIVSCSPESSIKLQLGKDNNIYISDGRGDRIIYRNYEKDKELFRHPYSLWSFDSFRIQWSKDERYVYIIDSIYDVTNDRLIPLKDCLVFSWSGNVGVYLSGGEIIEGKFWDNGFYGLYVSKCLKGFENGKVRIVKELTDDKHFIVSEGNWDEKEKTLFRCLGSAVEVRTAKFRFSEEEMDYKLIKAYQELRENEEAWELLNGEYEEATSKQKALEAFNKLKNKYPVKLQRESFCENRLNWDFDMDYYLVDVANVEVS